MLQFRFEGIEGRRLEIHESKLPTVFLEILYANLALLAAGICTLIVEKSLEEISYARGLKIVILALFLLSAFYYVIFTFRLPWTDFFADPYAAAGL